MCVCFCVCVCVFSEGVAGCMCIGFACALAYTRPCSFSLAEFVFSSPIFASLFTFFFPFSRTRALSLSDKIKCACGLVGVCVYVCVCVCVRVYVYVCECAGHFCNLTERRSEASHTPHAAPLNILVNLRYYVVLLKMFFNPRVYMFSFAD